MCLSYYVITRTALLYAVVGSKFEFEWIVVLVITFLEEILERRGNVLGTT